LFGRQAAPQTLECEIFSNVVTDDNCQQIWFLQELASRLIESLEDNADRDAVAIRALEPLISLDKAMLELGISRADVSR
jgi:hypothetical protein